MTRSQYKGPFIDNSILKLHNLKRTVNVYSRRSTIHPKLAGLRIGVYNGGVFKVVKVNEMMVGRKLGEFSPTRMLYQFKRKKQLSKKIKKKGK